MIIGHQKQWQFLKRSAQLGKISHAYLFSGQEKLGKKALAIEFIKLLFQEDIEKSPHPDFILVSPLGKEIQVSQIRDLNWRISLSPSLSTFKAAIIDQAHLMNTESQNCLLKTLEEPKGKAVLILITEYPEFLFPTILSRCQMIKFYPVKKAEIENYLKEQGMEDEKVKMISQISQGKPGVAIDFLKEPQKLKEREKLIKEISELTKADLNSRFQYAKKIAKSAQLKEILNLWLSYFRENLIQKCSSPTDEHLIPKLINIVKQIQTTNFLISTTNVNPRLALEILMLEL